MNERASWRRIVNSWEELPAQQAVVIAQRWKLCGWEWATPLMLILGSPPRGAEKHGGSRNPPLTCLNLRGEARKWGSRSLDSSTGQSEVQLGVGLLLSH